MTPRTGLRGRYGRNGEHGQMVVLFALCLIAIIAMAGLLIDGGMAWSNRRQAQAAADTAALAAAHSIVSHAATDNGLSLALGIALANGFQTSTDCNGNVLPNNGVTVNRPPSTGPHTVANDPVHANDYVEVITTRKMTTTFAAAVGQSCWMVSARAVAQATPAAPSAPTILAASHDCPTHDTLKWNGSHITVQGDVYSNGGLDINDANAVVVDGTVNWYDNPPTCDNDFSNDATLTPVVTTTYTDYPINYTAADFPCTFTLTIDQVDRDDGPYWLNLATRTLQPGVYCRPGGRIQVHNQGTNGNVTFVSSVVTISPADVSFTPYLKGVFIFAQGSGSGTIDVSGGNARWEGLIFAPNGDIHLVGADLIVGLGPVKGNIWGQTIDLGGNDWTIQGTVPAERNGAVVKLVE